MATAEPGDVFDAALAEEACAFFPALLRHVEGSKAGEPFELEPWQIAFVGCLFGWQRNGGRRYRKVLLYIPRKNGKTPIGAGLVLLLLLADGERGATVYSAAADREQAALVFRHAAGMVRQEAQLASRVQVYGERGSQHRSIVRRDDPAASYQVLSADADTKHGPSPHGIVIDELHAQPNRILVDTLATSLSSEMRRQPLLVYLTTADFLRPGEESICNEVYDYACKVRDGVYRDSRFLPVIYEAGKDDDWTDERTWRRVNPNLGVSVSLDYLRDACEEAKRIPAKENSFRRLHLNQRTEQDVRWCPAPVWAACAGEADWRTLREAMAGQECMAGLDLAATEDLNALSLWFGRESEPAIVVPFFWCPETVLHDSRRRTYAEYQRWYREGALEVTPGNATDYATIRRRLGELGAKYRIRELAIDRLFQGLQLAGELAADGFTVVEFGQGFVSMWPPVKRITELLLSQGFVHGGHPILTWNAANVAIEEDAAGCQKFSKRKSGGKIDGLVATVMALGRQMLSPQSGSFYDGNPVEWV